MTSHFMQFSATTQSKCFTATFQSAVWSRDTCPVYDTLPAEPVSAFTCHWFTLTLVRQ